MADLEERETAMTKAIKEVLEKHGHLLNGIKITRAAGEGGIDGQQR